MDIKMKGIYKSYGADNVLSDVDFRIPDSDNCALLGESGAGKSTLAGILGGAVPADKGEITIDGAPVRFRCPADAANAGIAVVYGDQDPIYDLQVYEYIFLGREITKYGITDVSFMKSEAGRILGETGLDIDPLSFMSALSQSGRQIVNICRAFLSGASVFILDGAIECLPEAAAQRVLNMLYGFWLEGKSIVIVSNTLKYVLPVCSRFVVMRDGAIAGELSSDRADAGVLEHMLRHSNIRVPAGSERFVSRYCVLRVRSDYFTFHVNKGEILGLTGSGFTDAAMWLWGLKRPASAKIYLRGRSVRIDNPAAAMKLGIAFVPRNQRENGIFPDMNIMDNILIPSWRLAGKYGFISRKKREAVFEALADRFNIKSGYRYNPISAVPAGSQQKALLARFLLHTPQVIILDNPAQRMQTADRDDIYRLIFRLAGNGASILLLSDDCGEMAGLCDRVLIMRDGRITGELSGNEINAEALRVNGF